MPAITADVKRNGSKLKDNVATITGVLALIFFGGLVIYLLRVAGTAQEPEWTRTIYLVNGWEAIAFAAAGFLFGREVHRRRAERAETEADEARDEATSAENRATEATVKGESLAAAIKSKAGGQHTKAQLYQPLGVDDTVKLTQADFQELENLANRLFPGH